MLSTKLRAIGRWLRYDRLLTAALVWLATSTAASLVRLDLLTVELGLGLAAVFALLMLLHLDRLVLGLAIVACLAISWVSWGSLRVTPVMVPARTTVTGTIVDLPQVYDSATRLTVAVQQSSVAALVGRRITLDVDQAGSALAGSVMTATIQPQTVSATTARLDPVRGVVAHGSAPFVRVIGPDQSISGRLIRLRDRIVIQSKRLWQEPAASLAAGLVVGNRANFDADLGTAMQATGTTHLVAVSGENLGVILWLAGWVLPIRIRWLRGGVLAAALAAFALLAGATPSVVRAVLLASTVLAAQAVGRPTDSLRLLALVATAMAFINPFLPAFDVGFQLSFIAVASLATVGPWLIRRLPGPLGVRTTVGITLGAYLATAPIILGSFGIVSLSSPLVNLIVQPITFAAMVVAGAVFVVALVWLPLGHLLAWVSWPLLAAIAGTIQWFARQSIPVLAASPPTWVVWGVVGAILLLPAWWSIGSQPGDLDEIVPIG